jgi:hypothetical protein
MDPIALIGEKNDEQRWISSASGKEAYMPKCSACGEKIPFGDRNIAGKQLCYACRMKKKTTKELIPNFSSTI